MEQTARVCPHCRTANPPYEQLCQRCSRSLTMPAESWGRRLLMLVALVAGEVLLVLLAFAAGVLTAPLVRSWLPAAGSVAAPPALVVPRPTVETAPTPVPAQPTPAPRSPVPASATLPLGEIGRAGQWEIVINEVQTGQDAREAVVDLSLRNAGEQAGVLVLAPPASPSLSLPWDDLPIPPILPRPGPSPRDELDRLILLLHAADSSQAAGAFFGADGTAYSFVAAPGDVIRVQEVFRFRAPAELRTLEALFGGGRMLRFDITQTAPQPSSLEPSPAPAAHPSGTATIDQTWRIDVQQVRRVGKDQLAVDLTAANRSSQDLPVLADPRDPQGERRDVFAVDAEGRLAWSEADGMPAVIVPAGAERSLTWWLTIGDEALAGPVRLSLISDWAQNRFAHVDVAVQAAAP